MPGIGWISANLLGMALYLMAARPLQGDPAEPGPGDGLYFGVTILPILVVCLLLNTWALYQAVRPFRWKESGRALAAWLSMGALWLLLMRHAQYIGQWAG